MARATPHNLTDAERALLAETAKPRLAELDEDGLAALHLRVRRARDKYVKVHRREAAAMVGQKGARGTATLAPRRSASKAELFEDALARVSRALGTAAAASARALRDERLAAARAVKAGGPPTTPVAPGAPASKRPRAATRRPVEKKVAASTRAQGKRRQAARDAR